MYARASFPSAYSVQPPTWKGSISFYSPRPGAPTRVVVNLCGLQPFSYHAVHVHERNLTSQRRQCKDLGGHWNPTSSKHGSLMIDSARRHLGDLCNNIVADHAGVAQVEFDDPSIDLWDERLSPVSRSVVIHEGSDDLGLGGLFVDFRGNVAPPTFQRDNFSRFYSYSDFSDAQLARLCRERGYGALSSRESAVAKLVDESSKTGNAGGRMACANVVASER